MEWTRRALMLALLALSVRVLGAALLGEGAPFGPDGTGAEAAVVLGGHPYPLHIVMMRVSGWGALELSMVTSTLSCVMLWLWGHRVGLGGAGGWIAATAPLAVFPGVLSAGDAPAVAVALGGALIATFGKRWEIVGGALAATCVAVKPIALPCLVMLLARPGSLFGAVGGLALLRSFLRPLWSPMPSGGLLGTWWVSSEGTLPSDWIGWLVGGSEQLLMADSWGMLWVFPLALLVSLRGPIDRHLQWVAWGCFGMALAVGCFFGGRVELRYFSPAFLAALPFLGLLLKRSHVRTLACALALWPTLALLTQVGALRAKIDPEAVVPRAWVVSQPSVEARAIFDTCSTEGATHLRNMAWQLSTVAPEGSTVVTDARPDGREGELFWPLLVLRPDLKVQVR